MKRVLFVAVLIAALSPAVPASAQLQCLWGRNTMKEVTATYVMRETRSVVRASSVELVGRPECRATRTEWTADTPNGRYACTSDDSLELEDTVCVAIDQQAAEGSVDPGERE